MDHRAGVLDSRALYLSNAKLAGKESSRTTPVPRQPGPSIGTDSSVSATFYIDVTDKWAVLISNMPQYS